jgi:hypothetical protein
MSDCPIDWPLTVPCSGHGKCVEAVCVCDEGWTGNGDFTISPDLDCDINTAVISVMSVILLISTLVCGTYSIYMGHLHIRSRSLKEAWHLKSFRLAMLSLSCNIGLFFTSIIKLTTSSVFGNDPGLTIIWWLCSITFLVLATYVPIGWEDIIDLPGSVDTNRGPLQLLAQKLKQCLCFSFILGFVAMSLPLLMLFSKEQGFLVAYRSILGLWMMVLGGIIVVLGSKIAATVQEMQMSAISMRNISLEKQEMQKRKRQRFKLFLFMVNHYHHPLPSPITITHYLHNHIPLQSHPTTITSQYNRIPPLPRAPSR